jgi:rhomboid protease GluP
MKEIWPRKIKWFCFSLFNPWNIFMNVLIVELKEDNDSLTNSPRSHRFFSYLGQVRSSWLLIGGIIGGFIIGTITDGLDCPTHFLGSCERISDLLAQQNSMVVYNHAYWQLVTSIFVTDSALDAIFNAIAVFVLDIFLSSSFNRTRYFAIFFASALVGNLLTLIEGPNYASAGASGGIFGLFAAAFSFSWAEDKKIDKVTLILFGIIFTGSSLPIIFGNVNWVAHVGGAICGFLAGPILYVALRERILNFQSVSNSSKTTRTVVSLLIALMIIGSIVQFLLFAYG